MVERVKSRGVVLAFLGGLSLLASGCGEPVAGGSCSGNEGACVDTRNALFCVGGTFKATPCGGVSGCKRNSNTILCDESIANEGEACVVTEGAGACASTGNAMLECQSGVFVKTRDCAACTISNGQVLCPSTCSSSNCSGCCFNGTCQTGTANSACGKNGATCSACGGTQVCKSNQTCGVDPESTWRVQPTAATISTTNAGTTWDLGGGAPDPWVELWCPATATTSTHTPTVSDTFNPTWTSGGCTAKAKDLMSKGFALLVWDEDVTTDDQITAKGTIPVTEADLISGSMTLSTQNGGSLPSMTIQLQKQ